MNNEKYVVVRSNMAGVFCGTLKNKNGTEVVLANARKIYRWQGAYTVEDIAVKGLNAEDSQITVSVKEIIIDDVCQVLPTTNTAQKILEEAVAWTF